MSREATRTLKGNQGLGPRSSPRRTLQFRLLAIAWSMATGVLVAALWLGARETGEFEQWSSLIQGGYVAVLLWYLARTGSWLETVPEVGSSWVERSQVGQVLAVGTLVLLLTMTVLSEDGDDFLLLFMMGATLWVLIAWHREIRWPQVVLGAVLALTAYLAGMPFRGRQVVSDTGLVLLPVFVLPMFVAAGLLMNRTGFGRSQLHRARFRAAALGFGRGCALFVPLGLVNALDDSPEQSFEWLTEGWMPLALPLFSGIAEEAWFRLFLVTLCYFLLRPVLKKRPGAAVVYAVLFSAVVFGLGHGRSLDRLLTTGLLYGLPMAVVFARRDWEHAVGAHYMVNLIPWTLVYLDI